MEQKPIGKLIPFTSLQDMLPSEDGTLHLDGGIMGPNGKWWIDAEGNAYFGGEMTVEKDVDPKFIQLVSTASTPSGMPNRSLWVQSNVLKYRDSGGIDNIVPVGTPTINPPTILSDINNNAAPGTSISTTESTQNSVSITPSSAAVSVYISAYWTGGETTNPSGNVPTVRVKRGSTLLTSYTGFNVGMSDQGSNFCGGLFYIDSPATTSSTTYNLTFQMPFTGTYFLLHSSLVIFECIPATA